MVLCNLAALNCSKYLRFRMVYRYESQTGQLMTYNHTKITVIFIFSEGKKRKKVKTCSLTTSIKHSILYQKYIQRVGIFTPTAITLSLIFRPFNIFLLLFFFLLQN